MNSYKKALVGLSLVLALALPSVSSAQTYSASIQAQIAMLLAKVAELQAQLLTLRGGGDNNSSGVNLSVSVEPSAPSTAIFKYTVNPAGSCDGGIYLLYFGDENLSGGEEPDHIRYAADRCSGYVQYTEHTYDQVGTYTAKMWDYTSGKDILVASVPVTISAVPIVYDDSDDVDLLVDLTDTATKLTTLTPASNSYGTFTLEYEIEAVDSDIYIPKSSAHASVAGNTFSIYGGSGFNGIETSILQSSASESGNYFIVREGQTEDFTLTVTVNPVAAAGSSAAGKYSVGLTAIHFDTSPRSPTRVRVMHDGFVTDQLHIPDSSTDGAQASGTVNSQVANSSTPTITGTANGVSTVYVSIAGQYGDKVYSSGNLQVTNGKWSHKVMDSLPNGIYTAWVYTTGSTKLGSGSLVITSTTVPPCCTTPPVPPPPPPPPPTPPVPPVPPPPPTCAVVNSTSCGAYGKAMYNGYCDSGAYGGWQVVNGTWKTCSLTATCPVQNSSGCGTYGSAPYAGRCDTGAFAGWEVVNGVWKTCTTPPPPTVTPDPPLPTCPVVNSTGCGTYGSAPWNGGCDSGSFTGWEVVNNEWKTCPISANSLRSNTASAESPSANMANVLKGLQAAIYALSAK